MNKLPIVLLIFVLAACAPAATPPPPTVTPNPPTATRLPPSATPIPPTAALTATPAVTLTPQLTPRVTLGHEGVRVTFVGNAGFLVEAGGKKILIDAICGELSGYEQPQAVKDLIYQAQPPFDAVDLILATHSHADHFDAAAIQHYLETNPETVFISTAEAVEQLSGLGERAIPISLGEGETARVEANGMQVEAFYLPHSMMASASLPVNLGLLVTVGETRILHTGDVAPGSVTLADLQAYGLPEREITLLFVPHLLIRKISDVQLLRQGFNAHYTFAAHYAYTSPAFNAELVARQMPEAVMFDQELQAWVMP
jgi:L-ascorbate metabolism protein UlaG (beta-lactamase superfamily)